MCQIALCAVFMNERHIITEWINHYLTQGVSKFFLIDNGSTDGAIDDLRQYIDAGIVQYIFDASRHNQLGKYNAYVLPQVQLFDWLIVVDLDEFMYGVKMPIKDILSSMDENVGQISIPWKMFGSAGFLKQPENVIKNFIFRENYVENRLVNLKSIVRVCAVVELAIHEHKIKDGWTHIDANGRSVVDEHVRPIETPIIWMNEEILESSIIALNHYPIQSREWFENVKMTRGSANCKQHDKIRTIEYFHKYDLNHLKDTQLCDLNYSSSQRS